MNIGEYIIKQQCRFCENNMTPWFDFPGFYPLAGGFLKDSNDFKDEKVFPLGVSYCKECYIFQCNQVVNDDILFKKGYYYYSSMIPLLVKHFLEYSEYLRKEYYDVNSPKKILEMGCNDGVLLRNLKSIGFNVIGVDPSNTVSNLEKDNYIIYNTYFNSELANIILKEHGKIDIFISSNSFAHIDDMDTIIKGIKTILADDGIIIIEVHNSENIIQKLNFDFIYHEHMTYYTKMSFYRIFEKYNIGVKKIEDINIHGGSIRVTLQNNSNSGYIEKYNFEDNLTIFQSRLFEWKNNFIKLFNSLKDGVIWGYGASGRANILLTFLGIKLDGIVDDAKSKIGSYMPINHLLIKDSSEIYIDNPKYIIILSWPYSENIIKKHNKYIEKGGKFILPLPNILTT
jgi:SAM-dependent methyltransferase